MNVPLSAEIHRDGEWLVAFYPEVPEANGQGHTQDECIASLREAILLLNLDQSGSKERPEFRCWTRDDAYLGEPEGFEYR